MSELKPCPFCGGEADSPVATAFTRDGTGYEFYVQCDKCCAKADFFYNTPDEATAAWNRRASGWVSVEERLPEIGMPVLVDGGIAHWNHPDCWFSHMEGNPKPVIQWAVTHWQPLPEPPEAPCRNAT